ncbi:hypothetical protein AB1Y20_002645 [Prymnesium parvum]|uniref:Uncharacterized protein n=1 Tax=Prymnesium parvum TaxID=97485 RepID=A0AB34JCD3_PRYPA
MFPLWAALLVAAAPTAEAGHSELHGAVLLPDQSAAALPTSIAYRTTPTGEKTSDVKAPTLHHIDGLTYMASGDVKSDVVVILTHSSAEPSAVLTFYSMFYGWHPSFYAVALDQIGDLTANFSTPGVACTSGGMQICKMPNNTRTADCSNEYVEALKWVHKAVTTISRGFKKVVIGGLSYGGVLMEDYIRWVHTSNQSETIHGLVLISNPTSDVWCQHFHITPAGMASTPDCGAWVEKNDTEMLAPYNYLCEEDPSGVMGGNFLNKHFVPNFDAEQEKMKQLISRYAASEDRRKFAWKEEAFTFSAMGNCPNATINSWRVDAMKKNPAYAIPHVHWSELANQAKARLPKLIVYSKTKVATAHGVRVKYAWPGIQEHVRQECTAARNCTLSYVEVQDWRETVMNGGIVAPPAKTPEEVMLWGHWAFIDSPKDFRHVLEGWVASAPI